MNVGEYAGWQGDAGVFFSKQWKKVKSNIFEYKTKEYAIKIWEEVDNLLQKQNVIDN